MYAGETENRNLRTLQRHAPDGAGDEDGKFSAISFVVFCYFHCILSIWRFHSPEGRCGSPKLETNLEDGDETKLRQKSETVADDVAATNPFQMRLRPCLRLQNEICPSSLLSSIVLHNKDDSHCAVDSHIVG